MSISQHRLAIEQAILAEWSNDLSVYPYANSVTQVPAVVVTPASEPSITFDAAFGRGSYRYFYDIFCLAPQTESISNQVTLDDLVDPNSATSVPRILHNNRSLGSNIATCVCVRVDNYGGQWSAANIDHIGALVRIEITTC